MELGADLGLRFVHTVISNGWRRWHEGAHDQPPTRLDVERQVFGAAFAIFCISAQERSDLVENYSVDPRKIAVVGRHDHKVDGHSGSTDCASESLAEPYVERLIRAIIILPSVHNQDLI